MKSPSWFDVYVVNFKFTGRFHQISEAFLENLNFKGPSHLWQQFRQGDVSKKWESINSQDWEEKKELPLSIKNFANATLFYVVYSVSSVAIRCSCNHAQKVVF